MSDAITVRASGFREMAAAEGVSIWWEGQGAKAQRLAAGASVEEWTTAAGMDWTVKRAKVRYPVSRDDVNSPAAWRTIDDKVVLVRSDTGDALGIVSDRYKVVQPRQCVEFFRDMMAAAGFQMNTAGTLHGGSKVWAQCNVGGDAIGRGDFNRGRVLIATSFDYSSPTIVKGVNESVVCANTLGFALAEDGKAVRVSHRTQFDAEAVQKQLGLAVEAFTRTIEQARELSRVAIGGEQAQRFVAALLSKVAKPTDEQLVKASEMRAFRRILELFEGAGRGSDLPSRKGTLWGLVNGVTDYVDHDARAQSDENRAVSATFGAGDALKSAAMSSALALLTA